MIDSDLFHSICKKIDTYTDEMVALQIGLTAIPALAPESGGDGEKKKADYLLHYLQESGFKEITSYPAPDSRTSSGIRPNLVTVIPGRAKDRTVWIITHIDVVPPGEPSLWRGNPYEAYLENGKIFGRGTEDNQQDLVASIFAAKVFIDEGITPECNIGLAFVADEETGSLKGLGHLLENDKNIFKKSDIIVVPDFGNDEGSAIEIAEKSILWLRFKTRGKQCHASVPALGKNAFAAASHLVVELNDLYRRFGDTDSLYDPPGSTFEPTKKEANVPNINTIPGEDVFYLDCRILPHYPLAEVMCAIEEMVKSIEHQWGVTIEISPVQQVQAPAPTPEDAPVVKALLEAVKRVRGITAVPVGIGGGTVAALFRKNNFPVAAWSKVNRMAHQPNEYCLLEDMVANAKVFAHLFIS
ncbi:MAG: M20 family metallo-hydrolase [Syntrophales bacterium]|nr:M20 family metallo-hydrolase [Syntrophales bacterium]MDY0043838.1 M20 family metallo-hydrolase [Syntrophales bacterium]